MKKEFNFQLPVVFVIALTVLLLSGCSEDEGGTGLTGGGSNLPAPAGGNPVGNWTLDYIWVPTIQNDSVKFEITGGSATGTFNLTQNDFQEEIDLTFYMHLEQKVNSQWQAVNDTASMQRQTEGNYTTQDSSITLTFTGSQTNPELVNTSATELYTAVQDCLIIFTSMYYQTAYGVIEFETDVVYKHP